MNSFPAAAASGRPKTCATYQTLASARMGSGQPFRERDTDRAHGDMSGILAQALKHAAFAEYHPFDRAVVCEHGDHRIAAASVRHPLGGLRPRLDQRLRLAERPIEDGDRVAGLQQPRRHAGSHAPQPNEADFPDRMVHNHFGKSQRLTLRHGERDGAVGSRV